MIRHVVMFKFKPEINAELRTEFMQLLSKLAQDIEVIHTLEIGQNFTQSPRAADILLTVDVEDEAALAEYADHPLHQPVKKMAADICSESRIVDYILPQ
jgi:hypothetical protein